MAEDIIQIDSEIPNISIQEKFIHETLQLDNEQTKKLSDLLIEDPELQNNSIENRIVNTGFKNAYNEPINTSFWRPSKYYGYNPRELSNHREDLYKNFNEITSNKVRKLEESRRIKTWEDFISGLIISALKDDKLKNKALSKITGEKEKTASDILESLVKEK